MMILFQEGGYMNQIESKEFKYIYNKKQALYFICNGIQINEDDIDINPRSGNIYFRFRNNDRLQMLFNKWCSRDLA